MRIRLSIGLFIGLAVVICLAAPATAHAQGFGLKIGFNNATLHDKNNAGGYDTFRGMVGGFYGPPKANATAEFQTEILYSVKGARIAGNHDAFIKLSYIEVPILERIKLSGGSPVKIHVLVGPSLAFRWKVDSNDGSGNHFVDKADVKVYDIGLAAGADVEIGHFVVDGRYTWGLVNILKNPSAGQKITNRALTVLVGIRFRKS